MAEEEKKNRAAEMDDFWQIDRLVPQKRRSTPSRTEHTEPVEIEVDLPQITADAADAADAAAAVRKELPQILSDAKAAAGAAKAAVRKELPQILADARAAAGAAKAAAEAIPSRPAGSAAPAHGERRRAAAAEPSAEYTPEHSLIKHVRVFDWSANYAYYESFRSTAMRVAKMPAPREPVRPVPFFSYVPQYSQLTDARLAFYLWMRGEIREGRCPEAEYSYVLLYIFELINLSDLMDPAVTLRRLCTVWRGYHVEHAHLNVNLLEWICDFCLIHGFDPPFDLLGATDPQTFSAASLKEFFVSTTGGDSFARLVMSYCTNYDYKSGKYAGGENAAIYDRCMEGAVTAAFSSGGGLWNDPALHRCRTVRDTYVGALCSPKVKKRLEVEYLSFSHSHELRFLTTDVMKTAENRIRAALGIKSRLKVGTLPEPVRAALDAYFDAQFPARRRAPKDDVPDYEKLYEPHAAALSEASIGNAEKIESASWQTTEKLIEAFSDEKPTPSAEEADNSLPVSAAPEAAASPDAVPESAPLPDSAAPEADGETTMADALSAGERDFLAACLVGDRAAQNRSAAALGMLPAAAADGINEKSAELFGDIVLEETPDGRAFSVIIDYEDDVREWI